VTGCCEGIFTPTSFERVSIPWIQAPSQLRIEPSRNAAARYGALEWRGFDGGGGGGRGLAHADKGGWRPSLDGRGGGGPWWGPPLSLGRGARPALRVGERGSPRG